MVQLRILGMLSEDAFKRMENYLNNERTEFFQYFFAGFSEYNIPKDTLFKRYYFIDSTEYFSFDARLVEITQNFGIEMEEIGIGWRTIIGLKFGDKIPIEFSKLGRLDHWDKWSKRIVMESDV
jgi:hypothetical protein